MTKPMKTLPYFILGLILVTPSLASAFQKDVRVMIFNRSAKKLNYKVFDEVRECVAGKLRAREKANLHLAKQTEPDATCVPSNRYRIEMNAITTDYTKTEDECVIVTDMHSQSVIAMWDGHKCYVKENIF